MCGIYFARIDDGIDLGGGRGKFNFDGNELEMSMKKREEIFKMI